MNHNRYVRALDHNGQFGQRVSMRNFDRGNFVRPLYDGRLQNSPYFLRIQVRASIQTKGLERGWQQRARLGKDAKIFFSLASHALRVWGSREKRA